jgi:hypothetical protein
LPRYPTIGAAMTNTGFALAGIGVLLIGWYLVVLAMHLVTRPRDLRPGPPTPDLGGEPPAVVNLLVTRCELTAEAADATLLDLAARRILEVFQPGDDPANLLVRVRVARPEGLNPYERRVFDRVAAIAGDRFAPLAEITRQYADGGPRWFKHLRTEVIADAAARGLVRVRKIGKQTVLLCVLTGMAIGCLGVLGVQPTGPGATTADGRPSGLAGAVAFGSVIGWFCASPVVGLLLLFIAQAHTATRDTPLGRQVGERWLGVAGWLSAHEDLADLPPAAVAIWDRYLAYGVALGVNPVASGAVDLRTGRVQRLRSRYTGTVRTVVVRYPWDPMAYSQAGVRLAWSLCVLACWAGFWLLLGRRLGHWPPAARWPLTALGVLLPLRALYKVVRACVDKLRAKTVTGQVLAIHPYRLRNDGRPRWYQLVVDDGARNRLRPWLVRADRGRDVSAGDVVRLRAQGWTRYVTGLEVLYRRPATPGSAPGSATGLVPA